MRVPKDFKKAPVQVRPKKIREATPCGLQLTALFNCWRTNKVDGPACQGQAQQVIECMRVFMSRVKSTPKQSTTKNAQDLNNWLVKVYKGKQV